MNSFWSEGDQDTNAPVKITKDKNGIDLVTLQNPIGFSVQVTFLCYFFLLKSILIAKKVINLLWLLVI